MNLTTPTCTLYSTIKKIKEEKKQRKDSEWSLSGTQWELCVWTVRPFQAGKLRKTRELDSQ